MTPNFPTSVRLKRVRHTLLLLDSPSGVLERRIRSLISTVHQNLGRARPMQESGRAIRECERSTNEST